MTPEIGKRYRTRNRGEVRVTSIADDRVRAECRDGEPVLYNAWPRVYTEIDSDFDVIAVARDAAIAAQSEQHRREAERAAAYRRSQPITRGEVLDALDVAHNRAAGYCGDVAPLLAVLHALREAFE